MKKGNVVSMIARESNVTTRTVQRWFNAGEFKGAYRTKGGHWRLRRKRSDAGRRKGATK